MNTKKDSEDPLIKVLLVVLIVCLAFPTLAYANPSLYEFPETIKVRVTGKEECHKKNPNFRIQYVDFKSYVKGVLPNEWGRNWDMESLKAGAIAVKMYAWSISSARGFVWDCTWSQVYNPKVTSERTDQAVDETWDYILFDNGKPVRTFFNAWIGGCYEQQEENCMGQWNSLADAENGMTWQQIITKYYDGDLICPSCVAGFPVEYSLLEKKQIALKRFEFMR